MTHASRSASALLLATLLLGGCDNVGRAFDPNVDPDDPGAGTTESAVQVVQVGGEAKTGRPKVRAAFPEGGGWPTSVPVVVEFTESVNEESIAPTSAGGNDGRIVLRAQDTTQVLPCSYDFLLQGRLLVLRPVTALPNTGTPTYEVVLLPDARDSDGVRFDVPTGGTVLTTFQVNQDETIVDGRILAVYPRDNARDATRETEVVLVFDRPATAATVVAASLQVRPAGGSALAGELDLPVETLGTDDGRIVRFVADNPLAAATDHEIVVTADIKFGAEGELDFRGRTPFSRFRTVAPRAPTRVELANPSPGFVDKINRGNVASPVLRVTTPADAVAGDRVRARIYGGDNATQGRGDLKFIERTADVTGSGVQTVDVDFAGVVGTAASPRLDDGSITFAAQLVRGAEASSYIHHPGSSSPFFDVTAPTLQRAGPPGSTDGRDLYFDLEHCVFYGVASERLGAASLNDGVNPAVSLLASDAAGRFLLAPIGMARLTAPRGYTLSITDRAGNPADVDSTGNLVQRGACTGALAGTLVVEAYDQVTLQPIAGATIVVDPGTPTLPASGQQVQSSDAAGRASFTTAASSHTVTIVRAGYSLVTLYGTQSAFVSLPLRPLQDATATFTGNLTFTPGAGVTAIVGNSAVDERGVLGVRTTNGAPTTIPTTAIVPNRPQVVSAFAGTLEPTATPTFTSFGTNLLGSNGTTPAPPTAPALAGTQTSLNLTLLPVTNLTNSISYTDDFATAVGFDFGNLVGGLRGRMAVSLVGFENQVLAGLGFATATTGTSYQVDATFSTAFLAGVAALGPNLWSVVEAQDAAGNRLRTRYLIATLLNNLPIGGPGPLPVPTITAPSGPATGAPAVTFLDVVDPASAPAGLASVDLTATDAAGRSWLVMMADRDVVGGSDTIQFPDLASASVAGLAAGNWSVQVETRLWFSTAGSGADDFVVGERIRNEVDYVRAVPVTFQVQ